MNIHTAIAVCHERLTALYEDEELPELSRLVVGEAMGMSHTELLLTDKGRVLTVSQYARLSEILLRLQAAEPIQYVLGKTFFYDHEFEVGPGVLIPRPETEQLCDLIVRAERLCTGLRFLDVGCGSGCIAISLAAAIPHSEAWAMDLSSEALAIASRNAERLLPERPIRFVQADMTQTSGLLSLIDVRFDLIVSNPPYIRPEEARQMRPNVLDYEPHSALFAPEGDPLFFYRHIAALAKDRLLDGGRIYLEVNEALAHDTAILFEGTLSQKARVVQDWKGKDRFVIVGA